MRLWTECSGAESSTSTKRRFGSSRTGRQPPQRNGRRVGFADAAIAAVAVASGFYVATRDTAPFRDMGAEVINPWS